MYNNLNMLEMKQVLELQPIIIKCQPAKYLTVKQFKPSVKR